MDLVWLDNGPGVVIVVGLSLDVVGFVLLLMTTTYDWIRHEIEIDRILQDYDDPGRDEVLFPRTNLATAKSTIKDSQRKWIRQASRAASWNRRRRWTAVGLILGGFGLQIVGQLWSIIGGS